MMTGGFGGLRGRRPRGLRRLPRSPGPRRSAERALSASALLPTVAFAGLGTVTVLLVAQLGMAPLDSNVGPTARDGGHAVTTPRMSVSGDPAELRSLRPLSSRAATRVAVTPTRIQLPLQGSEPAGLAATSAMAAAAVLRSTAEAPEVSAAERPQERRHKKSHEHKASHRAERAAEHEVNDRAQHATRRDAGSHQDHQDRRHRPGRSNS